MLVAGRWLVGWCFPKGDLDILDEPIPESLYCKRRRRHYDIEKGPLEEEEVSSEAKESEEAPQQDIEHVNISEEMDRCQSGVIGCISLILSQRVEPSHRYVTEALNKAPGYNVKTNLNKKFDVVEQQKREEEEKDEKAELLSEHCSIKR